MRASPPNGMVPHFSHRKHRFPYVTWFLMVSYGSYGFLWIMVFYGFLCCGSGMGFQWIPMVSYGFLWILMDSYDFLWFPYVG